MKGEKTCEYDLNVTGVSEYGAALRRAGEPIADSCEIVRLTTAADKYAWVNTRQIRGSGAVSFATRRIHIGACMQ